MLKDFIVAEGAYAIAIACVDASWIGLPNECDLTDLIIEPVVDGTWRLVFRC